MSKRNILILLTAALIVIVIVIIGAISDGQRPTQQVSPEVSPDVFRPENPRALPTVEGGSREIIEEEIATPELGATSTPEGVAVPTNVSQLSGPAGEAAIRDFEIRAEGGKFSPNIIVVNDGDIITVHLTAVDADYNIFFPDFGSYLAVKKGETRKTQFQTTPFGQYQFFCKDCGNEARGTLIVNEK